MITLRQQASNKVLAKPISCAVRFSAIQASTVADQLMQLRHAHLNPTRRNIHIHRTASCSILSAGPVSSTTSSASRRHLRLLHNDCSQRVIDQHQGRASYSTRSTTGSEPIVHDIFENKTGSWQYIIADPSTKAAAIVDPVLDYDPASRTISTKTADSLLSVVKGNGYKVDMILETHAHADHLTAAAYLKHRLAEVQGDLDTPIIGIGKRIDQIQKAWGERYNIPAAEYEGVFDKLFDDDETFHIGNMSARAIHLPGHTDRKSVV